MGRVLGSGLGKAAEHPAGNHLGKLGKHLGFTEAQALDPSLVKKVIKKRITKGDYKEDSKR